MKKTRATVVIPGKSQRTRQALLTAALEVFGEKGPKAATVRDIALASGQNVASIAYYFGSKDQLYIAVIQSIVEQIGARLGSPIIAARERLAAGPLSRSEALVFIKRFCRGVFENILRSPEALPLARVIVREQTKPSAAFDILYNQGFLPVHQTLTALVRCAVGPQAPEPEVVLRTHTILGQVFFFIMTREAILRRLNWCDFRHPEAEAIMRVVENNIDLLFGQQHPEGSL